MTTQQHKPYNIRGLEGTRGTQFTCFTGTKVQILTQKAGVVFKPKTTRESPCLCLKIQSTDTTVPGHLMVTGSEGLSPLAPHSLSIYLSIYVCVCIHAYKYTYIHTYIHACMHACMHSYVYTYIHTHVYKYMHTCVYTYVCP